MTIITILIVVAASSYKVSYTKMHYYNAGNTCSNTVQNIDI
jgi:hypothetical protein